MMSTEFKMKHAVCSAPQKRWGDYPTCPNGSYAHVDVSPGPSEAVLEWSGPFSAP